MNIIINTQAKNGHLFCYLISSENITILSIKDSGSDNCKLIPGSTYRFEWHVWSDMKADYKINAVVSPINQGFPDLNWVKSYGDSHQDMGGFYFSV